LNRSASLLASAKTCWARGRKIIHHCVPLLGPLTLLKVDTTSAFQHLTSKPKEIECCDE